MEGERSPGLGHLSFMDVLLFTFYFVIEVCVQHFPVPIYYFHELELCYSLVLIHQSGTDTYQNKCMFIY